ncbi:mechanosensitive ion channel [bacterium]|jgi:small-conductance mechanosensitive channel|nr:mechanosensitive ion channel [bacterium]MBT5345806.1 mechanosensitive ion channel [bacterium]MBT6130853.1 mechanosensitive ion channel [bacterium]MBT6529069.1 mechanosensitive ion channel [bacterium]
MKRLSYVLIALSLYASSTLPMGGLVKMLMGNHSAVSLSKSDVATMQERLDQIKAELEALSGKDYSSRANNIANEIRILQGNIAQKTGKSLFLEKRLSLSNQLYHVINELAPVTTQTVLVIEGHVREIQKYLLDPYFKSLQAGKSHFNFDDLQRVTALSYDLQDSLKYLEEKSKTSGELSSSKQALAGFESKVKDQKKARESAQSSQSYDGQKTSNKPLLTLEQKARLADEAIKLTKGQIELAKLRVKEAEQQALFNATKIFVSKRKLEMVKRLLSMIKRKGALIIPVSYVDKIKNDLELQRQYSLVQKNKFYGQRDQIIKEEESRSAERDTLAKQYNVSLEDDAKQISANQWLGYSKVRALSSYIDLLKLRREFQDARIFLTKSDLQEREVDSMIVRTWYRLISSQINDELLLFESKSYEPFRAKVSSELSRVDDERTSATLRLNTLNKQLDAAVAKLVELESNRVSLFQNNARAYKEVREFLLRANNGVRKQVTEVGRLIEVYSKVLVVLQKSMQQLLSVHSELTGRSMLSRSAHAITWEQLKRSAIDMRKFLGDLRVLALVHVKNLSIPAFFAWAGNSFHQPLHAITLLLGLLLLLLLFLLLRVYLPDFASHLKGIVDQRETSSDSRIHSWRWLALCLATLQFFIDHLTSIFIWSVAFALAKFHLILDDFMLSIIFLGSIPYLIYLSRSYFVCMGNLNFKKDYVFVGKVYQEWLRRVFSFLTFSTIILMLVREAFLTGGYYETSVPALLHAINFIIFQISILLLLLVSKGLIFSILPDRPWIKKWVDRIYPVMLIFVGIAVIMSHPAIGLGRWVRYIVYRLAVSIAFMPFFVWANEYIRTISSDIFFVRSREVSKERFANAKSWYGLFVITTFVGLISCAIFLAAWVWGRAIGWDTVYDVIHRSFYTSSTLDATGKPLEVSAVSILHLLALVSGAMVVATLINRFVLRRIFALLIVEVGIQTMLMALTRYIIVTIALLLGIQQVGLGSLMLYFGAVLFSIGWGIKELISDFFAYFIILIQRPIKIGDFVELQDGTIGVVRQITPRSVILRSKNSTTFIVPNSVIISKHVRNWNYVRSFVAFNDINITIPYAADPSKVKEIILALLEKDLMILRSPAPIIRLVQFGDNGYEFMIRAFISSSKTLDMYDIESDLRFSIVRALHDNSIKVAIPVRHVTQEAHRSD